MGNSETAKANFNDRHHLHVLTTHFPLSLFGVAFGFQILHLFYESGCFEVATNVSLAAAVVAMIPTTLTGWSTWKTKYKGAHVMVFQRKIAIAFAILAFGAALVIWRIAFLGIFEEVPEGVWHWLYLAGNTLLIAGAIAEGYYGGRLNHR